MKRIKLTLLVPDEEYEAMKEYTASYNPCELLEEIIREELANLEPVEICEIKIICKTEENNKTCKKE